MAAPRKGVLVVDDEAIALKYFSRAFGSVFPVYSVGSAREAFEMLQQRGLEIGVVVTDQRMPDASGLDLLKKVREEFPTVVRILTTAYTEQSVLVEAINSGAVFSFVSKPWDLDELETVITKAIKLHEQQSEEAELVAAKFDELRTKILEDRVFDVGMVSAKIGHYIHNALCPLTFLIEQLLEHAPGTPDLPLEFVRSTRDHLYDVAQTLKDLEQVSQPTTEGALEWVDLDELATRALVETDVIRRQKKLTIDKRYDPATPRIFASGDQMAKLFRFMIAEEIVSLPEESAVKLTIGPNEVDGEILGARIEFDDFVPIAEHTCPESLLHPFNLRGSNPREFGVFLVSCYFIVRHHGGSLNARINDSGGLSLSLFLPTEIDTAQEADSLLTKSFRNPLNRER